nr:MAG TPA: NUDIX domain protein [Bacteriophage sp.]
MERLTTRNIAGVAVYKHSFECERCGETIWRLPDYGNGSPTEKLAAYEDAENQGLPLPNPYRESEPHKQTNADRIRSMTDEELAMAIMCPAEFTGSDKVCDFSHDCKDCALAWLQKESEE